MPPLLSTLWADDRPADTLTLMALANTFAELATTMREVVAAALHADLAAVGALIGPPESENAQRRHTESAHKATEYLTARQAMRRVFREIVEPCVHRSS